MKKLLYILSAIFMMMCSSCAVSDDDDMYYEQPSFGAQIEGFRIEYKGDSIISPRWIQEIREEMSRSYNQNAYYAIWVYIGFYEGQRFIYFWDTLRSDSMDSVTAYRLDGTKYESPIRFSDFSSNRSIQIFPPQ